MNATKKRPLKITSIANSRWPFYAAAVAAAAWEFLSGLAVGRAGLFALGPAPRALRAQLYQKLAEHTYTR